MKETKLEKQKKNLVELGVMEETDNLIDFLQASYVERLIGKWGQWKKGWAYFTEERLIVLCRWGLPLPMRTWRAVRR